MSYVLWSNVLLHCNPNLPRQSSICGPVGTASPTLGEYGIALIDKTVTT
jgi:hypothetical protein